MSMMERLASFIVFAVVLGASPRAQDLSELYPATLERDAEEPQPLDDLRCEEKDVWRLSGFEFEFEEQLEVKLRASTLVIGTHEENAVWAVVLPDRPKKLSSTLGGDGEEIDHVFLRFHPSSIGALFPHKTLKGPGPREARHEAWLIYRHKLSAVWSDGFGKGKPGEVRARYAGYHPVLPPKGVVVLDMDTDGDKRRVFSVDSKQNTARYRHAFFGLPMGRAAKISKREAGSVFDAAAVIAQELMDSNLEPLGLDWEAHSAAWRRTAARSKSVRQVAAAVCEFLSPLDEGHIHLRFEGGKTIPSGNWGPSNVHPSGTAHVLATYQAPKNGIFRGTTPYGIGVVGFAGRLDEGADEEFDRALEDFGDPWGVVLDLRRGFRAEPELVERIMGRFVEEPTPYGLHAVWKGGVELTEELVLEPRGPWTFDGVVYALLGGGTAGEGERMAAVVKALPRGLTLGERTSGIGVGANWTDLGGGIELHHRNGRLVTTEGEFVPAEGMLPDQELTFPYEEFHEAADPLLYRALEEIYRTPAEERIQVRSREPWVQQAATAAPIESGATADGEDS